MCRKCGDGCYGKKYLERNNNSAAAADAAALLQDDSVTRGASTGAWRWWTDGQSEDGQADR